MICQASNEVGTLVDHGVFVHRVGTNPKRYSASARINYSFYAWLKLREIVKQYGIEVVEATFWGAEAFLYSFRPQVPLVVSTATSASDILATKTYSGRKELLTLKLLNMMEKFSARRADRIIANSRTVYDTLVQKLRISPDKIDIVHHGIDTAKFRYIESDIRDRLGIPPDIPLVLYVGRLEARKGVDVLCRGVPEIVRIVPDTRFVLVGQDTNSSLYGGSTKAYICKLAKSHGFSNALLFIDYLADDELIALYSACDLVVSPSLHESFGLVVLEAMACSKHVIATSTGVVPELGLNGASGMMISPGSVAELTEAVVRLLSLTGNERRLAAESNRKLVEAEFSIPVWVDKVLRVYEKAIRH